MFIFVDPSELKETSLFPNSITVTPCPGLEALTGCDFAIARIPISPVNALDLHLKNKTLFCQRKSGYDALNFDQLWLEVSRMKQAIPMQQCFVLFIGKFYDKDGLLRIEGKRPVSQNEKFQYKTFLKIEAELGYSGVQARRLNDESELMTWIEAQYEELERIEERGNKKEVWIKQPKPFEENEDIWQEVKPIDDEDWRYLFFCGLSGFGPKLAQNVREYIQEHVDHVWESGYFVLRILTEENEKGKAAHNIPGWGEKSRKKLRRLMGLPDKFNLSVDDLSTCDSHYKGWCDALDNFRVMVEERKDKTAAEIWQQLRNEEIPF
jgi:hypothetical protein